MISKYTKYKRTKKGMISAIFDNQKVSSKRKGLDLPTYTKSELIDWMLSQPSFATMYDMWVDSEYLSELKPSVDRIDSDKWYSMCNIQIMTWGDNNKKGITERLGSKHFKSKSITSYEINPITKSDFKRTCLRRGWTFEDFTETDSGVKYRYAKKYYYAFQKA